MRWNRGTPRRRLARHKIVRPNSLHSLSPNIRNLRQHRYGKRTSFISSGAMGARGGARGINEMGRECPSTLPSGGALGTLDGGASQRLFLGRGGPAEGGGGRTGALRGSWPTPDHGGGTSYLTSAGALNGGLGGGGPGRGRPGTSSGAISEYDEERKRWRRGT